MSLPVISVAQMREWENATWASGQTEAEVIRRVGKAVADRARQLTREGDVILLLAGKGHNGDDVRAAGEHLLQRQVELLNVTDPKATLAEFQNKTHRLEAGATLIVDGLFGIGLNRSLDNDWKKFIEVVNESKIPVLAVDVPSGLNADTGDNFGAAIRATVTLTVGAPKRGLLSPAATEFVGRLEVAANVGLASEYTLASALKTPSPRPNGEKVGVRGSENKATTSLPRPSLPLGEEREKAILQALKSELHWTSPEDFAGFPPKRAVDGHKGTFGHLGIIAGSMGYHGAAVLAARAAQRARPGLITLFPHELVYQPVAAQLQAVMVQPWSEDTNVLEKCSALLIGPGLSAGHLPEAMKLMLRRQWQDLASPLIVDAGALDWLLPDATPKDAVRVITPHPGEAAHLLKSTPKQIQANRLEALRELSKRFGNCWVILKGHQTLIGRSKGEVFVNCSGNVGLAQGGSGDVLAGFLTGLLAQPELQKDVLKTLCYAVWQHGAVADRLEGRNTNWIVEDLIEQLGQVGKPD